MFDANGWSKISGGATQLVTLQDGTSRGSPTIWGYKSSTDNLAAISEENYFNLTAYEVSPGDLIYAIGSDAANNFFSVLAITTDPSPEVITVPFSVFGDVDGPASSTLNALSRYSDTTGKSIKNSPVTVADNGDMAGIRNLTVNSQVEFKNPLGTFKTIWKAGANLADTTYTYPTALPTSNGQLFSGNMDGSTSWVSNANGDVTGPASSVDTAIPYFSGTSGKLLDESPLRISGLGNLTGGASAIFSGSITGNSFSTHSGGFYRIKNAANTFFTGLYSGAITADINYILPVNSPTLDDRPLVSAVAGGGFSQTRFLDGIILEDVTAPSSLTMARNKSYLSTNAGSRSTFLMPLSGYALHDVFRVVGVGVGGWEIEVNGTQTVFAGAFDLVAGNKIQSSLHTDIAYVKCIDATGGSEKFSLVIERGALTLPSVPAIITSSDVPLPVGVGYGGSGRTTATAYGLIAGGTTAGAAHQSVNPGTTGQFLVSNGASALPSFQNHTEGTVIEVTGDATIEEGVRYVTNSASLVTLTLPATFAFGKKFEVEGKGAGGWKIQANTGQTIRVGGAASSVAGSVASTGQYDTVRIDCITADTTFTVFDGLYAGLNVV